ncbi:DEAD/DEAH box helicase [Nocardioides sp.]|uniref:DEAD/DEAH box helicase n=1 Tax=Nocardioides sp. TaxID=35761 RepID=UPI0035196E7B
MGFVPLTGPAAWEPGPPGSARQSTVTFTGGGREVPMQMRAAVPILARARRQDDLHPTVSLLSGAVLLAMKVVAEGRLAPDADGGWALTALGPGERAQVVGLVRAHPEVPDAAAWVPQVMAAVADTLAPGSPTTRAVAARRGRSALSPGGSGGSGGSGYDREAFAARLQQRVERQRDRAAAGRDPDALDRPRRASDLPHLVRLALRIEAEEEDLRAGRVRLVVQVHDETRAWHFCDAAALWADDPAEVGFGERARLHTTLAVRRAAEAWSVLDRLLDLAVPDELELDAVEIGDLLEHGVAALRGHGIDVLWPRSLGRDLVAAPVLDTRPVTRERPLGSREEPLQDPLLGTEAVAGFRWQLAVHGDPLTEEEMDDLAAAAAPIVKLRGTWTVVDPATARRARKRLIRSVTPAQAMAAALTGVAVLDGVEQQVVVAASLQRVREQVLAAASRDPLPAPALLQATLRDYQRHGLTWLHDLTRLGFGGCLADDMGLGKTITVIALHLHRHADPGTREADHGAGPLLVVCPASLLGNWAAELARFAPHLPVRRFHSQARDLTDLPPDAVVLTTYGTARVDAERLGAVPWGVVVADEAQHIKNPASATAKALRTIGSQARVALSGTPVENALVELWAILDWATPGLLGSRNAFRKAWAQPIESGTEPARARQFADLVAPFLLRRRKSDPGIAPELPAKTETDHPLTLTREQVVLYEAFVRETLERLASLDADARRGLILALLTGLKQICNHPAHFLKESGGRIAGRSEKLDLLEELVATAVAEDGAVLVFTQYVAMARLVGTHLDSLGIGHQLLHGGTPVAEREAMVARFQAGEVPVFLLSLKAGGTGLNLTRADHVVHLDRWWNPAVEEQATDRAYRIGQTRPVQVHRILMRGTVEERIAQLLARKRGIADAVLGRGEAALTELSDAELRDLVVYRPEA